MYEARYPARGFLPNDKRLVRKFSSKSSLFLPAPSETSEEPFIKTNAKSVTNLTSQKVRDEIERKKIEIQEVKKARKNYLKELPKNDS